MRGSVAAIALLAIVVTAVPSEKRDTRPTVSLTKKTSLTKDGVVNVKALKSHVSSLQGKYAHTLATFEKNTGKPHPSARIGTTANNKRQTGSVPLTDDNSELWYGAITVGLQKFTVDFDTGSSDLFLPGPNCFTTCRDHTIYTAKGAKDTGKTFSLKYGDGSTVSGEVFTDSVTVAGLTAKPQAVGAAKQYSPGFQGPAFPADGLMGLAWPQISQITATQPFFNTLSANKAVSSGEFGFKLSQNGAVFYLGGVDPSSSSGNLNTVPVTQKGYWQVNMDSVNVGGSAAVSSLSAIIDTGTTFIIGDPSTVAKVYSKIPGAKDASSTIGAGFYTFPCSSNPQVSLTFGGVNYDISRTFNLGLVQQGSKNCVGGIIGQNTGINAWIAGDVFLANVYAQFSFDKSSVGFSKQA